MCGLLTEAFLIFITVPARPASGDGMRLQQAPRTKPARVIAAAALAILPALRTAPAAAQSDASIQIQPTVPADIPGGAQNANLTQAAIFAGQEFIGLNWPATAGTRETPDTSQFFGQNGTAGGSPLVWETLRAKVELFPGNGSASQGPHGWDAGPPSYGYGESAAYIYNPGAVGTTDGNVAACTGQQPPAQPAWINLDEVTQIGLDTMYAGVLPSGGSGGNTAPQLIRFMAKANSIEYAYVVQNQYWYKSSGLTAAQTNFVNAVDNNTPPPQPYVFFPAGTIEVKAAWRPLAPADNPAHFHTATVRFYETGANNFPCYIEAQWALIALHIIQKTPTAPAFIFATFEQAENILTATGASVENTDGAVIKPQPNPTTPAQTYMDSPTDPQVSIVGSTYCTPQQQLFYLETSGNSGVPDRRRHLRRSALSRHSAADHRGQCDRAQCDRAVHRRQQGRQLALGLLQAGERAGGAVRQEPDRQRSRQHP
jgi:hypothetical protein